jgi:hypothetical protein
MKYHHNKAAQQEWCSSEPSGTRAPTREYHSILSSSERQNENSPSHEMASFLFSAPLMLPFRRREEEVPYHSALDAPYLTPSEYLGAS